MFWCKNFESDPPCYSKQDVIFKIEDQSEHIRHAAEAHREIYAVSGTNAVAGCTFQNWFAKFCSEIFH